jgi:hypothetical protein
MKEGTMDTNNDLERLQDWAHELGCTAEELLSAMEESGRSLLDLPPGEQFELDLGAPA